MIKFEYIRFMQTLTADDISDDVRKIANVVFRNINTLIPLTTSQGHRINKLVELTQKEWNLPLSFISQLEEKIDTQIYPISQIKSLSVGSFRGFLAQEEFDLASNLVLVYGQNGTGKSSFCEALEYGLLGVVAEAETGRFRNQNDYYKNVHTNTFVPPSLTGINTKGSEVTIDTNETLYRFCFIEKNRIDDFSRIAAQAPSKQMELISTLFGMDDFLSFVRNFTASMESCIDIEGVKAKELTQKKLSLTGFQQQQQTVSGELQKIKEDGIALAEDYKKGCTFQEMVVELNGTENSCGLIKQFEAELAKPIASKSGLKHSELHQLLQSICVDEESLNAKKSELTNTSKEVAYQELYDAIIKIKSSSNGLCPACKTPLTHVTVDPFCNADSELKKLKHLSELKDSIKIVSENIKNSLIKLSQIVNKCYSSLPADDNISPFLTSNISEANESWWKSLHNTIEPGAVTPLQYLENHIKVHEENDEKIEQAIRERNTKQSELNRLRNYATEITKLQERTNIANKTIMTAKEEIAKFDILNATLIADVETEKNTIVQNKKISDAYSNFVKSINRYKDNLPSLLVADLGETVVRLYNAFNRNDDEREQLAEIRLPLQQHQRLEVSFKDNPDTFYDALHVLSEGHTRCVGLAILTAKNIKENCPLLIFDDPVNAIDDDHREAIRKTLFEDNYFDGKQIILTCHGEEFFKDIQNLLPTDKARRVKLFSFLPKINYPHLRIDHDCAPRNYIIASRTHFDKGETRDALDKCRKALEALTKNRVWGFVNKHGDGKPLSIALRSAKSPIELRNLTEQLKKKIAHPSFSAQNKDDVLMPIEKILGLNGDSREWRYLNKGTHEEVDREEFNRHTVNEILTALESLDSAIG